MGRVDINRATAISHSDLIGEAAALKRKIQESATEAISRVDALRDDLAPAAFSGDYADLENTPALSAVATSGDYSDLTGKPALGALASLDSITTAKISNWSSATSSFITASSLTPYAKVADLATVATTGNYSDLSGKPTIPVIPTNVSAFTNDAGYLTQHQSLAAYAKTADLAVVATSGSYSDLSNKPSIPTVPGNVSAFTNDAGYLTEHQDLNGWLPKPVAESQVDLNTLTEQGVYYVIGTVADHNLPVGSNGVLFVFNPGTGSYIHQWFRRYGTAGSNDHHIYVRAKGSGSSTWGAWTKILTSKDSISTNSISDWASATSDFVTAQDLTPVEVTLTDAGYVDFTTLKAWRTGNVVNVSVYLKLPATAPSSWTTIATGLPAPMAQLKTVATTWAASYARGLAVSVETDGTMKCIYGKASSTYALVFSYVTAA